MPSYVVTNNGNKLNFHINNVRTSAEHPQARNLANSTGGDARNIPVNF